eukprot:TRINITY_DN5801_c1_g1_i1.p2 TRINITY_DN5801_c1_g1~~TRINITY_DN5801_c1_g1_i1.p2  ORF type:complete len:126 (+),score=21.80 TRINITY_DN5801_c1_g1_i1:522-899(+)
MKKKFKRNDGKEENKEEKDHPSGTHLGCEFQGARPRGGTHYPSQKFSYFLGDSKFKWRVQAKQQIEDFEVKQGETHEVCKSQKDKIEEKKIRMDPPWSCTAHGDFQQFEFKFPFVTKTTISNDTP